MLFSRFLLVGLVNTVIGLSTMYILLYTGFSYWYATFLGNAVGACVSYFLNKTFTFRDNGTISRSIFRFFIVIGTCYFIAYFIGIRVAIEIIELMVNTPLEYAEHLAILIGTVMYTLLNFIGQKRFVFSN